LRAHSENASKEDRQLTKRTEEAMLNVKLAATRFELLLDIRGLDANAKWTPEQVEIPPE
jgi:hypothetical protein